jgi:hypothetical protein
MGVLGRKLRGLEGGRVAFFCPGCDTYHQVTIEADPERAGPIWGWNRDADAPTFWPSILVAGVQLDIPDHELDRILSEFTLPEEREMKLAMSRINTVCHSFVRQGRIEYLTDCTHALAGQEVNLPDVEVHDDL